MLMALFILLLLFTNIIVMGIVLSSQRISVPRCGNCSSLITEEDAEVCPDCRSSYLNVGIAAGIVMRPPPRTLLCLAGLIVAISCIPFLIKMTESFEYFVRTQGDWHQTDTVILGVDPMDPASWHGGGSRIEISGVQVGESDDQPFQVSEVWIELSFVKNDDVIGEPLHHQVLHRDGSKSDLDLSLPYSTDEYLEWLKEQSVFPEDTSSKNLEIAAQCIEENIALAFINSDWGDVSVLTVKTPFTRVSSMTGFQPMPLPLWQMLFIRILMVLGILMLIIGVLLAILRFTSEKEVARS